MLSRAGQAVLRPLTPSTTPPTPKAQTMVTPRSSTASVDASIPLSEAASVSALDTGGSFRQKTESAPDLHSTVRRTRQFAAARRRLTVESSRRQVIGDFIDRACERQQATELCASRQHPAQEVQTPGAVLSVWGSATSSADRFGPCFAQKPMNFDGELSRLRHRLGVSCHRGYKPESPNQDDFFVLARCDSLLLGVLDGHGPDGHEVSHFTQERLPTLITERLRQDRESWREAVTASLHELCGRSRNELGRTVEHSGTTVTIAMLDQQPSGVMRLRSAFLGDSIAVHARRRSKGEPWQVSQLTDIHRPDRADELERIRMQGGTVLAGTGRAPPRLHTPGWNLAMSRSFGDFESLPYGLSNEPEFPADVLLDPSYQHLLLICSDGVWDVIRPLQAVQIVGKFSPDEAQLAVERLVTKARLRWQEMEDVVDDITAVLVWPGAMDDSGEMLAPEADWDL